MTLQALAAMPTGAQNCIPINKRAQMFSSSLSSILPPWPSLRPSRPWPRRGAPMLLELFLQTLSLFLPSVIFLTKSEVELSSSENFQKNGFKFVHFFPLRRNRVFTEVQSMVLANLSFGGRSDGRRGRQVAFIVRLRRYRS